MSNGQNLEEKERERKVRRKIFYLIFGTLALISCGFLIWKLSILILPIIVGALMAFLFRPVKERFEVRWLPHEIQVLCSFAAIGLVLFVAFNTFRNYIPEETPTGAASPAAPAAPATTQPPAAEEGTSLESKFSAWILAPLIFLFLGFDNGQIRRFFISLVPNRYFELSLTVLDRLDDAIGRYLRGTLIECFLVGLTLVLGLILLGIPLGIAVAIGVVSGLLNAIPFLGALIALVFGVSYALIAEDVRPLIPGLNPNDLALYVVVLVVIAHVLDDVVFQPFVLGGAVNVHRLVVVIAIIAGSLIMGLWGMLFAIPTVVVVKTAVETFFKELKDYRII